MAEARVDGDLHAELILSERIRMVPEEVVEVARSDGIWMFKIEFQETTVPCSLLIRKHLNDHLPVRSPKSIQIVWNAQWMHDVPENLARDRYWNLVRTLDTIIYPSEDVVWLPESSLYAVGDYRRTHLCLEPACLDSKGTQCPRLAVGSVLEQLADEVSTNGDGRAEQFKNAVEHLGTVVQDTYNSYPNDPARMTAAMLAVASSDNPFRRLMRV